MKNLECSNLNNVTKRFIMEIVFIVSFFLLAFAGKAFSQDIIIKKDKSEIKVKVIEIQETSIKYKPFEFLDGPLRSISISDVSSIKYENGNIETFTPVSNNSAPVSTYQPSQEISSQPYYYPLRAFAKVSYQVWDSPDVSDGYENNVLLGVGIEQQLSDDFKIGADIDYGPTKSGDYTLSYTQLGAFIKYSWHPFGTNRPNVCGGLGIKDIFLKESGDDYSEKGNSIGFSALLAVEIPFGKKTILDLGWNTVWSKMKFNEADINVGSEIFYAGLIFNLW